MSNPGNFFYALASFVLLSSIIVFAVTMYIGGTKKTRKEGKKTKINGVIATAVIIAVAIIIGGIGTFVDNGER